MRTLIVAILMVAGTTVIAQQTNTLDTLRQIYEKKEQSILDQYGKDIDTITATFKKKGDLDNVLILQSERKRFDAERNVLAPKDAKDTFRPAIEEYCQTMVKLLEQYVTVLDSRIKKETAADRIEEAMLVKTEKDKASFLLADMLPKLPVKAADEKTKTKVSREIEAVTLSETSVKMNKETFAGEWLYKDPAWWSRKVVIKKSGSKYQMTDEFGRTYEVKLSGKKMHISGNGDNATLEYGDDNKWKGKNIDTNARTLEKQD